MTTDQAERSATATHARRSSRGGRLALALALPVGVVTSGALVWQASYAAFTATTENAGNQWSTGTVTLTDNDAGGTMFAFSGLDDADAATKCITVTYTGELQSDVRLYASNVDNTDTLAPYLDLVIHTGTKTATVDPFACGDFAPDAATPYNGTLAAMPTTWDAPGLLSWTAATNGARTYRIAYSIADGNAAQDKDATATFTFEARSTGA